MAADEGSDPSHVVAPLRFGVVQPNLYRGSYPRPHNYRFLRGLGLKTILSVTPEPLDSVPAMAEFAAQEGIQLIHIESAAASSKSKKKRGVPVSYGTARKVVECLINDELAPLYVHCLNGSQITCLLVACMRKLSFWSMSSIAEEFSRYADFETADETFVENFRTEIEVPEKPAAWMWKGLSKSGVVKNHPTLKINDHESRAKDTSKDENT